MVDGRRETIIQKFSTSHSPQNVIIKKIYSHSNACLGTFLIPFSIIDNPLWLGPEVDGRLMDVLLINLLAPHKNFHLDIIYSDVFVQRPWRFLPHNHTIIQSYNQFKNSEKNSQTTSAV